LTFGAAGKLAAPFFWRGVWARLDEASHKASGKPRFPRICFGFVFSSRLFLLCFFDASSWLQD